MKKADLAFLGVFVAIGLLFACSAKGADDIVLSGSAGNETLADCRCDDTLEPR